VLTWLFFGWLYAGLPLPERINNASLQAICDTVRPKIHRHGGGLIDGVTPYYFSAATLTTLGDGDVSPALDDWKGQTLVVLEAAFGLVAWGCFVTLLVQTLQRRPDY
jgi:hypothetical protein